MGAAVMGGGIQFGLSTLLPSPAPSGTDSSLQQARSVAGEVTARLQALPLSDGQRYILASSLRPAPRNPFTLPANGLPDAQQAASANASGLVYSGYVQAGKEALAIIGGLNWGSIGLFQFDFVAALFGGQDSAFSRVIFALVGLAALWCISLLFRDTHGKE